MTIDSTSLIIGISVGIILLALIVVGMGWGLYQYASAQRKRRSLEARRSFVQTSSLTQLLGQNTSTFLPPDTPHIRWATNEMDESLSSRIQWGETQDNLVWTLIAPPSNNTSSKICPICRGELDEAQEESHHCPICQNAYHRECWAESNECPICQTE